MEPGIFVFLLSTVVIYIIFSLVKDKIKDNIEKSKSKLDYLIYNKDKEITEKNKEISTLNNLLLFSNGKIKELKRDYEKIGSEFRELNLKRLQKEKELNEKIDSLKLKNQKLEEGYLLKDKLISKFQASPKNTVPLIASLYADFCLIQYDITSNYLETKKHPAINESYRIKELKSDAKLHLEKYRQMVYKYEYLLQIFPELTNYVDDIESISSLEDSENLNRFLENYDKAADYISQEEYKKLSIDDRNQLALDRYIKSQKTNWQIGRDYEMFCGMEYQKQGYKVTFFGIEKKLEDMGRDLIAIKNNQHLIVQCKYWAKHKLIHEKHILQLYGSAIEYKLNNNTLSVLPVFITNTNLSEKARQIAKTLGVDVKENTKIGEYPRIKCNINRDESGNVTKIYHLPFDQKYDKTKIELPGEFYAFNVKEAVDKSFRRAYKYYN